MKISSKLVLALAVLVATSSAAFAQGLNWEGQTGGVITPFAYTAKSANNGVSSEVAFHHINAGEVVGNYSSISGTFGVMNRAEFGYTRVLVSDGEQAASPLFAGGFNVFHGKLNVVRENTAKKNYIPALSLGFVARTSVRHVGGVVAGKDTKNWDIYAVATKTITQFKPLPIVVSGGVKGTNASIFGIAGNAPDWSSRAFGTVGFVVPKTPKSTWIVGSEFAQQPKQVAGVPGLVIPTSLTYFVRAIPKAEKGMNFDVAVAQVAGKVAPGIDLKSRAQIGAGVSYHF